MTSRPLTTLLLLIFVAILSLFSAQASAAKLPQKSVVISYPNNVPGSVVDRAKDAIREAGGMVTHEYKIFKGFAATAPVKAFDTVKTLAADWPPLIEEDLVVTIEE